MWSGGIRLDDGTYSTLVRAFVHWGDLGRAVRVLHRMRRAGLSMRRRTVQPLLHRLCDEGLARAAVRCWERTEESGAAFVAEDYVRMLGACCRAGELDKLPALMRRLRDGCEDRLPRALLTQVGDALRAARLPDGSAAFDATSVEMGESAIGCSHCGTHLAALRLSDAQRQSVLERLLVRAEAIDRGGALLGSLMQFDAWLKERPGYDCVIDGPNVVRAARAACSSQRERPRARSSARARARERERSGVRARRSGARASRRTMTRTTWAAASTTTRWRTCGSRCSSRGCSRCS